jgi:hypothetical protein
LTVEARRLGGVAEDTTIFSGHAPLVPVETRYPYYIVAPPYEPRSAGIKALHLLCHWLNRSGFPAFIHNFWGEQEPLTRADLITPLLTSRIVFDHLRSGLPPIVVYPEVVSGNPLEAKCVVRYILNYPGLMGGDRNYDVREMIFAYTQSLADAIGAAQGVMHMPLVDTSLFRMPDEDGPREGACFYAHKFRRLGGTPFGLPEDAVEILNRSPDAQTPEQIAELLRRSEKLYAFEDTALILEAALCGCPTVIMRNEFYQSPLGITEYGGAGLAFTDSDADVARARESAAEVARLYNCTLEQFWRQFDAFISATQNKAAHTPLSSIVIENPGLRAAAQWPELDRSERRVLIESLETLSLMESVKYYVFILSKRRRRRNRQKRRIAQELVAHYRKQDAAKV